MKGFWSKGRRVEITDRRPSPGEARCRHAQRGSLWPAHATHRGPCMYPGSFRLLRCCCFVHASPTDSSTWVFSPVRLSPVGFLGSIAFLLLLDYIFNLSGGLLHYSCCIWMKLKLNELISVFHLSQTLRREEPQRRFQVSLVEMPHSRPTCRPR